MLFDLFLIAKLSIKIKYPNIFLLFIENLCFCCLKISGASKNCRLKITAISKNYRLKIPVRVRMYARMYVRVYDCQDSTGHTTSTPADTGHRRKREEHRTTGIKTKFVIIERFTRKKRKKLKKVWKYGKSHYLCRRNNKIKAI